MDEFTAVDALKKGDRIEVEFFGKGIRPATIDRVYRIGGGKYFDLSIEFEVERFFGGTKKVVKHQVFDYTRMIRNIVRDEEDTPNE